MEFTGTLTNFYG